MQIRPDGRWQGKLTSRPLPERDESIEALSLEAREELARHWLSRAASERRVGEAFVVIRDVLSASGTHPEILALAERAVDDEARHTLLSLDVAARFAGRALSLPDPLPLVIPEHRSASAELRRSLHVIGQCAFNETLASSVLEASLAATSAPFARAAMRELLSDEVDHARIGWAYLATLDAATKVALEPWLLPLAKANLRTWRTTEREYPSDPGLVVHGALTRELLETALMSALRGLIVPGFIHMGMDVRALERWVEQGAPTA